LHPTLDKAKSTLQASEGVKQEVEVTNGEGWTQLDFSAPAKDSWKIVLNF